MIALNTVKGIIEISSWRDIVERPHFRSNINPTNVDLKEIIGSYNFQKMFRVDSQHVINRINVVIS